MIAVATLAAVDAFKAMPPTFAQDFYTGQQSNVAIVQGGYETETGACCDVTLAPGCKVQYISTGGDIHEQGSKNRTRSDTPQGTIITWFGNVKKQMVVVPGSATNSSHNLVCVQYCPTQGDFVSSVQIGDGKKGLFDTPKDLGKRQITQQAPGGLTKVCELWQWTETILGIIPMEKNDFYVDTAVSPPVPFVSHVDVKPLGEHIGTEMDAFINFTPMEVEKFFDVDPSSIKSCPKSEHCNEDSPKLKTLQKHQRFAKSMLDVAEEMAPLVDMSSRADPPPPPALDFGTDFTANEEAKVLVNQGGVLAANGDVCCLASNPGQCQVQLQHSKGVRHYDLTNQRERFDDSISKRVHIDFYGHIKKSILVNVTNGVETCAEYCPIHKRDSLKKFDPWDPFDTIKDLGQTVFEGKPAHHYQWSDMLLKIIKMQTTDFYVNQTGAKAVPLFLTSALTPFGMQQVGSQNQSWTSWELGAQPAKKFSIAGLDTCPLSNQCQSHQMQGHRMRTRQLHTFYSYTKA